MYSNVLSTVKSTLARSTSLFGVPLWVLLVASTAAFIAVMIFVTLCIYFICYRHRRKPYKSRSSLPKPIIASKNYFRRRDFSSSSLDKRLLFGNNNVSGIQINFDNVSSQAIDVEEDGGLRDLESIGRFSQRDKNSFNVEEIEEATNGLAKENVIGSWDHGIVYLGLLPDNTRVVVKRLLSDRYKYLKPSFLSVEGINM